MLFLSMHKCLTVVVIDKTFRKWGNRQFNTTELLGFLITVGISYTVLLKSLIEIMISFIIYCLQLIHAKTSFTNTEIRGLYPADDIINTTALRKKNFSTYCDLVKDKTDMQTWERINSYNRVIITCMENFGGLKHYMLSKALLWSFVIRGSIINSKCQTGTRLRGLLSSGIVFLYGNAPLCAAVFRKDLLHILIESCLTILLYSPDLALGKYYLFSKGVLHKPCTSHLPTNLVTVRVY